ncbi:ABC transporter permease [Lyngbya confervoides]|uniref:Iron ABC transporter permease n=1 Tax=Lyngbya confervoides BDU141951 TaxID=1574623 RepID=A0ABD4T0E0_9CYAN|nr:iron ABC transporter permease [Lyngbya confervoides]MCM1981762.1 iron ABC transporter permease [Lyngbya confervoides BDU141951]
MTKSASPWFGSWGRWLWAQPGWTLFVLFTASLVALPILTVLSHIFADSSETWAHLAATVLPSYLINSLWLSLGVSLGVLGVGVSTAWFVAMCRFPGRAIVEWALLLPLSTPAYVLAYTYTDFLDVAGPVQQWLRSTGQWQVGDYWFPEIRSLGGAIAMLVLVLYPYVYMLARVAFLEQSNRLLEASQMMGCNSWRSFWLVAFPLARPSIVVGVALVLMETLNDFGTVQYFGVDTFTTGIYRVWTGFGDRQAATQLAAVLLLLIFGLVLIERWSRGRAQYYQSHGLRERPYQYSLSRLATAGVLALCWLPITLGFLLPTVLLGIMTYQNLTESVTLEFTGYAGNSFFLAGVAAIISAAIATALAYGQRLNHAPWLRTATRFSAMGYAIPGSVIAVGIAMPFGWLDQGLNLIAQIWTGSRVGLVFSGTALALIFAYLVRFLAVSFGTVEAGLSKIKPSLDEAARSLGRTPTQTLWQIHRPLMWSSILTAVMLVFVDVMKELPATLMINPTHFETLAVRVYRLASDERLAAASAPALAIVAVGLLPVIVLSWQIVRSQEDESSEGIG